MALKPGMKRKPKTTIKYEKVKKVQTQNIDDIKVTDI